MQDFSLQILNPSGGLRDLKLAIRRYSQYRIIPIALFNPISRIIRITPSRTRARRHARKKMAERRSHPLVEKEMVAKALAERGAGNRTSYAPSALEPKIVDSHFHDMDLCILLHHMGDNTTYEVVKKALRKALGQRSMRQYRKSFHDHDPSVRLDAGFQPYAQERLSVPSH
ncbi:hypothetical protein BDR05DRAFT_1006329 [Suillus weaverae]|nr:hypothetical protein BDR05DRAFT_1006329 [Suillus weaverae]